MRYILHLLFFPRYKSTQIGTLGTCENPCIKIVIFNITYVLSCNHTTRLHFKDFNNLLYSSPFSQITKQHPRISLSKPIDLKDLFFNNHPQNTIKGHNIRFNYSHRFLLLHNRIKSVAMKKEFPIFHSETRKSCKLILRGNIHRSDKSPYRLGKQRLIEFREVTRMNSGMLNLPRPPLQAFRGLQDLRHVSI